MMRPLYYLIALCGLLALALSVATAQTEAPATPDAVIAKMLERNPSLNTYTARVHVDLRMLNFPFLAPSLDGTSYYKRPNSYEVVFDRVPGYAKGFEKIFNDVGDPLAWQREQNITLAADKVLNGRPVIELDMTKKIHSTILDRTVAYIDPSNYELVQMEWHYTSGGTVVMRQWYRQENGYSVISQQHVEINIPHVHAVGDSRFATYQTNVAIDDTVFTKQ
jgi:outer membrane lipoprotein-sorting protein